jgi:hypothetical protein
MAAGLMGLAVWGLSTFFSSVFAGAAAFLTGWVF